MTFLLVRTDMDPEDPPWFVVMVEEGDAVASCGPFEHEPAADEYADDCNRRETMGGVSYHSVPCVSPDQFRKDLFESGR